jgi:hypothetical protein
MVDSASTHTSQQSLAQSSTPHHMHTRQNQRVHAMQDPPQVLVLPVCRGHANVHSRPVLKYYLCTAHNGTLSPASGSAARQIANLTCGQHSSLKPANTINLHCAGSCKLMQTGSAAAAATRHPSACSSRYWLPRATEPTTCTSWLQFCTAAACCHGLRSGPQDKTCTQTAPHTLLTIMCHARETTMHCRPAAGHRACETAHKQICF